MHTSAILQQLSTAVGSLNLQTNRQRNAHFTNGWRSGQGSALAVLFPQRLIQLWRALEVCVENNCIVIMQAANTGLTEGSTPSGDEYDRPVIVINTLAINQLFLINKAEQIISLAGTTLHQLEQTLAPLGRAPHSVIGSSCLGASVIGGIANNSGGALVKRGPAYTELALFARVNANKQLELINHLGIELGDSPETILTNLENGQFEKNPGKTDAVASATDYIERLRDINAATPSRYNADTSRLFEASGCAGKLAVFAVRLDTFEVPKQEQTFYIGTNQADTLTHLRQTMLTSLTHLPDVAEYMHRDCFSIARKYGKDTFVTIERLGTQHLPRFFSAKARFDHFIRKQAWLPASLSDKTLQWLSRMLPEHIPARLRHYEQQFEHHLIIKTSDAGIAETREMLNTFFTDENQASYFECSPSEARKALLHRFAAAGAAVRYQTMHKSQLGDMLALDIALPRNEQNWVEQLPSHLAEQIDTTLYYGHFLCHVFHQDYILKRDTDTQAVKQAMLALLDERGAKYPAEHNVGHLYQAEEGLQQFYRELDPTNMFNPGVGNMPKNQHHCRCC